jgi:hypothetical protein
METKTMLTTGANGKIGHGLILAVARRYHLDLGHAISN